MSVTDPIADMLTRVRNAVMMRHSDVLIPLSNTKLAITKILKEEGFIRDFSAARDPASHPMIKVHLNYRESKEPAITGLKRVSKPGLRVYVRKTQIPRYYGGLGVAILLTSQGILTGREAWRKGLGGELLCYVW